jgi:hypothetical protein
VSLQRAFAYLPKYGVLIFLEGISMCITPKPVMQDPELTEYLETGVLPMFVETLSVLPSQHALHHLNVLEYLYI